ncbi:MAG: hypothetical protein O7D29_05320 [Gemmatimonadetes bacterium]|nr:hypothetical protein [Gemmatimonadota bacterium]
MTRVAYGLAVLLLSLAVTPLSAQRGQRRQFGQAPPSPVQMVLDGADELFLSDEQIELIAEIGAELDEKNASIMQQMQELRRSAGGDFSSMRERMRPIREQLRSNSDSAMIQVNDLLGEEQQEWVAEMIAERQQQFQNRRPRQ